jgi:drug/metabolite transporter (DMT)-like permease
VGYAFVVFAVLLWAGNAVVGRVAPDANVPPVALNFWRWVLAFLVLVPFAVPKLRAQWALFKAHWWLWTVFGMVTVAGFNTTFYIALQYTTAVQATLISAILPVLVLLSARVFLGQPIVARQAAGVAISIAGVVVVVTRGDLAALRDLVLNIGDVWMLVAVCFWAAQTILIRFLPKGMDLVAFQVAAFVVGLAVLLPIYLGETAGGRPMPVTWSAALYVGYTALVASVMGFTCWNMGVLRIGPKTAGYFGNLFPVFGAALGILLLGEPFQWFHAIGGMVILGGIYLATVGPAAPRPQAVAKAG